MGGAPDLSSLSHMTGAATSWLSPDAIAAESRRKPRPGVMVVSPALEKRAFKRASLAAMPVAHGPHMMLLAAMPAKQTTLCQAHLYSYLRMALSSVCSLLMSNRED